MKYLVSVLFCVMATASAVKAVPITYHGSGTQKLDRFMLVEKNGTRHLLDLEDKTLEVQADLSDVTYYVYSQDNFNAPCKIIDNDLLSLIECPNFDGYRKTLFIIHGWNNNYQSKVNSLIKTAALESRNINVIVVDWNRPANSNYFTALSAVPTIGTYVGSFINSMVEAYNIKFDDITIVGHSLGAHVSGCAGHSTKELVGLIVGLDPAGPLVDFDDTDNCLDQTDAKYVQAIHTCAGFLGTSTSVGHSDFLPNGGSSQPGCGIDLAGTCAHGRSYEYFAESIQSSNFVSKQCSSYNSYFGGKCDNQKSSLMGTLDVDSQATGDYYLTTNSKAPYAQG